jgi:hypothetical protein
MVTLQASMEDLQRVVDHIFLPPKLPHSADETSDGALLDATLSALSSLSSQLLPDTDLVSIRHATVLLKNMKASMPSGKIEEPVLRKVLLSLTDGQTVAVKVGAQNAAVLITRHAEELVFEAFELSAQDEHVIATKGRLVRTFPGLAVATSASLLLDSDFSTMVVNTLSTMCSQQVPDMQPKSYKGGKQQDEERDTTNPAMVTELFMGVLVGIGKYTAVSAISKNTRDEVLWHGARVPWRRSPMWLLIRVALQLVISRSPDGSRQLYKEVLVFLMGHILNKCEKLSVDMLYVMKSKIQRRMHKLSAEIPVLPPSAVTFVTCSLKQASDSIEAHWKSSQQLDARALCLDKLTALDFAQDTSVALPALDKHIEATLARQQTPRSARYVPTSHLVDLVPHELPDLRGGGFQDSHYVICNLDRFETWVARYIDGWTTDNLNVPEKSCEDLHRLFTRYYSLASKHYSGNPEAISLVTLTAFELWIAGDKIATHTCPLLLQFDPGIPVAPLQKLLLPFSGQMKRLLNMEQYLNSRQAKKKPTSYLFATSDQSFANLHFNNSVAHKQLRKEIETAATIAQQAKSDELSALKTEYARLGDLHTRCEHDYVTRVVDTWCDSPESEVNPHNHRCAKCQNETVEYHSSSCQKCRYAAQRDILSIDVHEWPLPSDDAKAKTVVFELDVPSWFSHWRDARLELLEQVLKGKRQPIEPSPSYILSSGDPHLTAKYFKWRGQRVSLLSQVKPFIVTHYKTKLIGGLVDSHIYVENALRYAYYDVTSDADVGGFSFSPDLDCTYSLSNKNLRRFLFRPETVPDGLEPNNAISSQSDCPDEMSLEEYKEWAALPLGRHIQWPNILLQLAMPSVDFKKPETTLVFLQCIYQAGPSSSSEVLREAHDFFNHGSNANHVVQELTEALQRVKGNWESSQALHTFTAIASRVLSLSKSDAARSACLAFLSSARAVAMGWVRDLREKAYAAEDADDRTAFIVKSVEVALVCTSTFDIDKHFLPDLLAKENNTSILIQCSIILQEGEHCLPCIKEHCVALLQMRCKRLLQRAHHLMVQHSTQIDDAVRQLWADYVPGDTGWTLPSAAGNHWLSTDTVLAQGSSMSVHYDLLSGELLVNGLPMDQPPKSCRDHPLYSTLFKRALVEVMPCTAPGLQFSTKRPFGGYNVRLGIAQAGLLVEATKEKATKDDPTYETIPKHLVKSAFPAHYTDDFVHWLDVATKTVQFRPADQPWDASSPEVWTLSKQPGCTKWQLVKGGSFVIGVASATSKQVSDVLEPLADRPRIHNLLQPCAKILHINIPTLRVNFHLESGSSLLESQESRSMVVDDDQTLGTFIGLHSKVLLRHLKTSDRVVLVPESNDVHFLQECGRIKVSVSKSSISKVHTVHIDPLLGRLRSSGELSCNLYLAYLHALTSFCLVDPLTGKTGTEQALATLASAAVKSFGQLSQANVDILAKFAGLTPGREYYPKGMRVMQTLRLDNKISFLSQHGHFMSAVQILFEQSEQAKVSYPEVNLRMPKLSQTDEHLLQRDNIRSATLRVSGFGAEDFTVQQDAVYAARDRDSLSQRAVRAAAMSNHLFRDAVAMTDPVLASGHLWQRMASLGAKNLVSGPTTQVNKGKVRYDASLLHEGHNLVLKQMLPLHQWLGETSNGQLHKFSVAVWLSAMAIAENADMAVLQTLAMFFRSSAFAEIAVPNIGSSNPSKGKTCMKAELRDIIIKQRKQLASCPENDLAKRPGERHNAYKNRCAQAWAHRSGNVVENFANALVSQWPIEYPATPSVPDQSTYINTTAAMPNVVVAFKSWHDNMLLNNYLESIEKAASRLPVQAILLSARIMSRPPTTPAVPGAITELEVFEQLVPHLPVSPPQPSSQQVQGQPVHSGTLRIEAVLARLEASANKSGFERKYTAGIRASRDALVAQRPGPSSFANPDLSILTEYMHRCEQHVQKLSDATRAALSPCRALVAAGYLHQWPRLSPTFFLQQLSRKRWAKLPEEWRSCILQYGLALAALQRARRFCSLSAGSRHEDLANEMQNPGHENWDPMEFPETLLMEIESDITVRPVQEHIADQMRKSDGDNAVMQLNMGEGKSSCIVPMVASTLADGKKLVRVIVAKPQSQQMAQMLISKLGGLLDRRVYYMPISRSLKFDSSKAKIIRSILQDCMGNGGVLLVQPEHILSLQLMAPECYISGGREDVGRELMLTLDFLEQYARDIVDESDENFSVKFELVYTMGTQRPIEFGPDRWLVLQEVLDLVRVLAVAEELPLDLECYPGAPGSFPRVRILKPDAGVRLMDSLAAKICTYGLDGFQISRQPKDVRSAVHTYITKFDLDTAEIDAVEGSLFWTEATKSPLLLLRGLLAGGVLQFTLGQKRWRVQYGLATTRSPPTKLAVPYRAKDSPSPRSEFSHPEVIIILTLLSYYYEGLTDDDLFITMGHLMESDQADVQYQAWVRDAPGLSTAFKQLQGTNLKDRPQCISEVFPKLRSAKSVVDYFLARIVFPKEMKEFPFKLSASGWDLGKRKDLPVTGFSGTNDSRCLLPVNVQQLDIPEQKHTNALVLNHIAQPENGVVLMKSAAPGVSDAQHLLHTVLSLQPPVEVILDVGAQILELVNVEVAKTWLNKHPTKLAAVFVSDSDELSVVDRDGRIDLLRSSSYFTRLDTCLVFLDEAHTRGIDLVLPTAYRAAVTLGANLTKDRLAQACMRMRKLGKGQTVVFCISPEIQTKITECETTVANRTSEITVDDVLLWSIAEMHTEVRRSMPLWAVQGERFVRQETLWQQVHHNGETILSKSHAEKFQEDEAQSIDDRYRPHPRSLQNQPLFATVSATNPTIQLISERCEEFDDLQFRSSTLQEEQERELSPEVEQERQIQRAAPAKPLQHTMHVDVEAFADTGNFNSESEAFMPAFQALQNSSAANAFPIGQLVGDGKLFVTADFAKTVEQTGGASYLSDGFQRPVQWLLMNRIKGTTIVDRILAVSPWEANKLYTSMRHSSGASLHLYKPRSNSGYAPLDRFDFHTVSADGVIPTVPRALAVQLDLFAGQLYISSYQDFLKICNFLGFSAMRLSEGMSKDGWKLSADGFILSDDYGRVGGTSALTQSPANFFKVLMSKIRRNGDGIAKTHMGSLLEGKLFQPSDFDVEMTG